MKNLLDDIEEILLMGPGPSCIHPEVYKALSLSTLGHLDPYFIEIMDQIQVLLQKIMNTKNKYLIRSIYLLIRINNRSILHIINYKFLVY